MSEDNFLGKPKKYMINGVELELKPLTVEDADIVMDLGDDTKRNIAMKKLIGKTLQDSGFKMSDFGLSSLPELSKAIIDINGLGNDDEEVKIAK